MNFSMPDNIGNNMQSMYEVNVESILFYDTGTFNPQYLRPWNLVATGSDLETLKNEKLYNNSASFDISSNILKPSINPVNTSKIINGWDSPRLRFVIKVITKHRTGAVSKDLIQGYTDYAGVTSNNTIDTEMVLYVNSIVNLKTYNTANGVTVIPTANQILVNNENTGVFDQTPLLKIRPKDVYNTLIHSYGISSNNTGFNNNQIYDATTLLDRHADFSKRSYASPHKYLNSILNAWGTASQDSSVNNLNSLCEIAKDYTDDRSLESNSFFKLVGRIADGYPTSSFKLKHVLDLDQTAINRMSFLKTGGLTQISMHQTGMTAHWHGTDNETMVATMLSQAAVSIMIDSGITGITFNVTNDSITGEYVWQFENAIGFSQQANITQNVMLFKNRIEFEILNSISTSLKSVFYIAMNIDLIGNTFIRVKTNAASQWVDYMIPTFADSLFAPTLTNDVNQVTQLAQNFHTLASNIYGTSRSSVFGDELTNTSYFNADF